MYGRNVSSDKGVARVERMRACSDAWDEHSQQIVTGGVNIRLTEVRTNMIGEPTDELPVFDETVSFACRFVDNQDAMRSTREYREQGR